MGDLIERIGQVVPQLLPRGQEVLVGVSGGMDSMVLLNVLHELSREHRWKLTVAHLNHKLRGRSSDGDQKLVERAAEKLRLPVISEQVDVRAMAAQSKGSIEMVARRVRHEFLAHVAKENKIGSLALAHHADDQVELFFLRLFRGAGGDGLAGMQSLSTSPVDSTLTLIRPLLGVSRREIEAYARKARIPFREDASNKSDDYLRNRVRNKLLPLVERDFQPAIRSVVRRTMELLAADADCAAEVAMEWLEKGTPPFDKLHVAVQRRALQLQLIREGIPPDFELIEWLRKTANKPCSIGTGKQVSRNGAGRLRSAYALPRFNENELTLHLNTARRVQFDDVQISWRQVAVKEALPIRHAPGAEKFDADLVGDQIALRHWRKGDRFQPIGMRSTVKLQDLFANAKVPRTERHQRLVAATPTGEIFWVEGLRISERFKLRPETRRVLEWKWRRQELRNQASATANQEV